MSPAAGKESSQETSGERSGRDREEGGSLSAQSRRRQPGARHPKELVSGAAGVVRGMGGLQVGGWLLSHWKTRHSLETGGVGVRKAWGRVGQPAKGWVLPRCLGLALKAGRMLRELAAVKPAPGLLGPPCSGQPRLL